MKKINNFIVLLLILFAIELRQAVADTEVTGSEESSEVYIDDFSTSKVYDPWETWNRKVFNFNDQLDTMLVRPVATGYRDTVPSPLRSLVTNVFSNLSDVKNGINALLQLKLDEAAISTGRFFINSTIGMLGMLDVAKEFGLEQKYQDFGLTLARWHVPDGPYVVLPFWGPRSFRAAVGFWPDLEMNPTNAMEWWAPEFLALHGIDIIDTRANLLDAESLIIGDRYSFIRDVYMQQRTFMLTGELPEDDF